MGMTAVEKILARACGLPAVRPGDIVYPEPDLIVVHDFIIFPMKEELDALGIDRLHDPDRIVVVTDHSVIYTSPREAKIGAVIRKAVADWKIKNFFDVGQGGQGHIFLAERGYILPGMFVFDNDRHSTNHGAYGAFALRTGTEMSRVVVTGTLWTMVPKTIRLSLQGKLQPGVYARDVGLYMATRLRKGGGFGVDIDYRVLELAGPALDQFSLDARVALCTSPTEVRAIGVFIPPTEAMLDQIRQKARRPFTPVTSDRDADFEAELELDISPIGPQVALTGTSEMGTDIAEVEGIPINHAVIGSCGAGKWEDLVVATRVLRGNRVAPGVRLFIVPGSEDSTHRLHREGLGEIFHDAGAILLPAGCGPCYMGSMAPVHTGEVSISTVVSSPLGRMGEKGCELFVASPATVAASAVAGRVTDPRTVEALIKADG